MTTLLRAIGATNPDSSFRNPDYLAIRFLGQRERAVLPAGLVDVLNLDFEEAIRRLSAEDRASVTTMFIRTKYFDNALNEALAEGVRQVVILGAGFDSRGYRFADRLANVRFLEVDYGPTQEYKKQRVKEILGNIPAHVQYIPMDFTKDDLLTELRRGGYSEKSKTIMIWEGVTMYIPESAVEQTLGFVRNRMAADSRIIFDYALASDSRVNNANTRFAQWGEPWLFGFPGDSASDYVRYHGLTVASDVSMGELESRLVRGSGTAALPSLAAGPRSRRICVARVPATR